MFSRQRTSPGFIAATARSAVSPIQSSTNFTGRLMMRATSAATGLSDFFGLRPFGRPKCESRITLPPLSAIPVITGAMRSTRVASVTTPFSTGKLRSARTSTRWPFTSAWSSVLNALIRDFPDQLQNWHEYSGFPAFLQDRREVRAAAGTMGGPNGGRGADLAIFPGIRTHFPRRLILIECMTIDRLTLALVMAAAAVPR